MFIWCARDDLSKDLLGLPRVEHPKLSATTLAGFVFIAIMAVLQASEGSDNSFHLYNAFGSVFDEDAAIFHVGPKADLSPQEFGPFILDPCRRHH
ncbi:MAG: hypothetical protein WCJ75_17625 [Desulfomonile sp.]